MSLNKNQLEAVTLGDGPALIIAGPGSGKTTVITHRIKFLIENLNISPNQILVITFTKQAAIQMNERFTSLMDGEYYPVSFGTFHAIFYHIILSLEGSNKIHLITENDKFNIVKTIINETEYKNVQNAYISEIIKEFSLIKNKRLNIEEYNSIYIDHDRFVHLYKEYNIRMRKSGKIDFDDMMERCLELLRSNTNFLNAWQERYKYILVDEFQDINPLQYDIVRLISAKYNNVFAVGDDDQSIYSFRGASPRLTFSFLNDYENVKQVFLSINYRCSKDIVNISKKLIGHNKERFNKNIQSEKDINGQVNICKHDSSLDEYKYIVDKLIHIKQKGTLNETVILHRTNNIPREMLALLLKENIPFTMKGNVEKLYDSFIVKDIKAYFDLSKGKLSIPNLIQVMNKPNRYISRAFINQITMNSNNIDRRYTKANKNDFTFSNLLSASFDKEYLYKNIFILMKDLEKLSKMDVYSGINFILKHIGYEEYLYKYAYDNEIPLDEIKETISEITNSSKNHENVDEWLLSIRLQDDLLNKSNTDINGVMIMTIHASKGLEWDNVFLPDVNLNVIPYKRASTHQEIEEERRLFYVGITRARENIYISYVENKAENKSASPFIKEIADN